MPKRKQPETGGLNKSAEDVFGYITGRTYGEEQKDDDKEIVELVKKACKEDKNDYGSRKNKIAKLRAKWAGFLTILIAEKYDRLFYESKYKENGTSNFDNGLRVKKSNNWQLSPLAQALIRCWPGRGGESAWNVVNAYATNHNKYRLTTAHVIRAMFMHFENTEELEKLHDPVTLFLAHWKSFINATHVNTGGLLGEFSEHYKNSGGQDQTLYIFSGEENKKNKQIKNLRVNRVVTKIRLRDLEAIRDRAQSQFNNRAAGDSYDELVGLAGGMAELAVGCRVGELLAKFEIQDDGKVKQTGVNKSKSEDAEVGELSDTTIFKDTLFLLDKEDFETYIQFVHTYFKHPDWEGKLHGVKAAHLQKLVASWAKKVFPKTKKIYEHLYDSVAEVGGDKGRMGSHVLRAIYASGTWALSADRDDKAYHFMKALNHYGYQSIRHYMYARVITDIPDVNFGVARQVLANAQKKLSAYISKVAQLESFTRMAPTAPPPGHVWLPTKDGKRATIRKFPHMYNMPLQFYKERHAHARNLLIENNVKVTFRHLRALGIGNRWIHCAQVQDWTRCQRN